MRRTFPLIEIWLWLTLEYSKILPHAHAHAHTRASGWVEFPLCVCVCLQCVSRVRALCHSWQLVGFSWTAKWGGKYFQLPSGKLTWCRAFQFLVSSLTHTFCRSKLTLFQMVFHKTCRETLFKHFSPHLSYNPYQKLSAFFAPAMVSNALKHAHVTGPETWPCS